MTQSTTVEIHHAVSTSGQTALDALNTRQSLPHDDLLTCFQHGAVWLETSTKPNRLYDSTTAVHPGQTLHLYCNRSTLSACPYQPELVQDHKKFSIWYKPAGMLSQGSKWGDHWTLHRWIKQTRWPQRDTFITHRLDRFTQGLMIVAHDATTNREFHRLFEKRRITKTYRAVVLGLKTDTTSWQIDTPIDGKTALSNIRVLAFDEQRELSLLQIEPLTGRKHQIRIHLSTAGHPIINDRQYGHGPFNGDIALQACALDFTNPCDGEKLSVRLNSDKLLTLPRDKTGR